MESNKPPEESVPLALIAASGQIVATNAEFSFVCGIPADQLLNANVMSLVLFADPAMINQSFYYLQVLSQSVPEQNLEFKAPLGRINANLVGHPFEIRMKVSPKPFNGITVVEATLQRRAPAPLILVNNGGTKAGEMKMYNLLDPASGENSASQVIGVGGTSDYHSAAMAALASVSAVRPQRILVVDDAFSTLKVMAKMISRLGQEVHTAKNGLEALELLQQNRYDLVVMDIFMPTMNGLEASSKYRQIEAQKSSPSQSQHQAMIAISGENSPSISDQVGSAGFDGFIPKPLTEERFRQILLSIANSKPIHWN